MEALLHTAVWAAIIQGLFLGLLYLFSRKHSSFANRLLGFFLFSLIAEALTLFLPLDQIGNYPLDRYFSLPEVKLFFPLLFFHFVLEKIGRAGPYRGFLRVHYALAWAVLAITPINVGVFLVSGLPLVHRLDPDNLQLIFMSQQVYAFLLTILAFVLSLREILRYRNEIQNTFSDLDLQRINWLWQFLFSLAPVVLLWGAELLRISLGGKNISPIVLANWGLVVLFIYFVSYKAFRHQNLFEGIPAEAGEAPAGPDPAKKEAPFDHEDICRKVQALMEAQQYYLRPDLSIYELARETGIPARQLSGCINRGFGVNFSEWVNQYRVEAARRQLEDPRCNHLSIEGIGADAGFKSRSAMYAAFRKHSGRPPGDFRKETLS